MNNNSKYLAFKVFNEYDLHTKVVQYNTSDDSIQKRFLHLILVNYRIQAVKEYVHIERVIRMDNQT